MSPNELKELGYPSISNIKELIQETEGIELIEESDNHYIILDDYNNDDDKVLQINKKPDFKEDYFEFFDNEIDRKQIYDFAKDLPPLLFMNLKKVYFVERDEDLTGEVDEESPNHTFYFSDDVIGMAIYRDSVAFINLRALKKLAKEENEEDLRLLGYSRGYEGELIDGVCETLVHELFHLTQFNPLIESYIPDGEDEAEDFCRYYSGN